MSRLPLDAIKITGRHRKDTRAARHCTALHPRALRNPHVLSDGTVTIYCGSCNRVVTLREPSQYGGKDRSDVNQPGHGGALASDSVMGSLLFD